MNRITNGLEQMSEEELYALSAALDCELEARNKRTVTRGSQRSTYVWDVIRGKRSAVRREPRVRTAA